MNTILPVGILLNLLYTRFELIPNSFVKFSAFMQTDYTLLFSSPSVKVLAMMIMHKVSHYFTTAGSRDSDGDGSFLQ